MTEPGGPPPGDQSGPPQSGYWHQQPSGYWQGQPPAYGPAQPPPGYPGAGYPPPGYGYGYGPGYGYPTPAGPPQDKPSSNWGWAIAAVFLFWPLAIPSFIYASKVDTAWNTGRAAEAQDASRSARMFGMIGVFVGGALAALAIIWFIVVFAFIARTVHDLPAITQVPQPFPS